MNAARRKQLAQATDLLVRAQQLVEGAASDEQDYYDNMPEGIQMSEKGDAAIEAAGALAKAGGAIGDLISDIEGAIQ